MKKSVFRSCLAGLLFACASIFTAQAQFMPVVFDGHYGKENKFTTATADFQNGDVVVAGMDGNRAVLVWVGRTGEARFSKRFQPGDFSRINKIIALDDERILLVGTRHVGAKENARAGGRAIILNVKGGIERNIAVGSEGTEVLNGTVTPSGAVILSGSSLAANGQRQGYIWKVSSNNRIVYSYGAPQGEVCEWFSVLGSRSEYLNAAFTAVDKKGSSVVRLDQFGKPYFITRIPDPTFKIARMESTNDGDIYLVGVGQQLGGALIKIRPEGEIVFQKQIVPTTSQTRFDKLIVCRTGEILVGGSDSNNSYYALLRSDGTELSSNVDNGMVSGIAHNPHSGECIVSLYDAQKGVGKVVKLSKQGKKVYQKATAANYTSLRIDRGGDLLMGAPSTGRLSQLSSNGVLLFDRYVKENTPTIFAQTLLPANGEAVFMGTDNHVAKLAHGVYVSDVTVNKPLNGYATAVFTVTLSGYSFSSDGAPKPVTVNYKTRAESAIVGRNFDTVSGTLSFIPSTDGNNSYLNVYEVKVPVNANDFLEGDRTFALDLSDVSNSYLVRNSGKATIADQPAIVKMIACTPGLEGERDIVYELGIFKTNGTPLTNATKADIVIDGIYGQGTADLLDFDQGRLPRLIISPDNHCGTFNVVTKEDTRYEVEKSVVINFNKIYSMSDTDVSFGSNILACEGSIIDQPAMLTITSLGNYNKLVNTVTDFYKISLVRAKDGVTLTNNSGGDIIVETELLPESTAKLGSDFVFSNAHDLRIWGDGKTGAVNLTGMVLYTPGNTSKSVTVKLKGVKAPMHAGKLTVSPNGSTASFGIKLNN